MAGWQPVLRKINFTIHRGEAFGLVGRIRLRQIDGRPSAPGLSPSGEPDRRRPGAVPGPRPAAAGAARPRQAARRPDQLRAPESRPRRSIPASASASRWPRSCSPMAARRDPGRPRRATRELFALVGLPDPERPAASLSPSALGRAAAAGLHRHGAGLRARPRRAGRADHGPRRHHPGADRRAADRSAPAPRHVDALCHPRSRRAGRRSPTGSGVMYAGHMVEIAPTADLFGQPRHPYTRGLIASIPRLDQPEETAARSLRGLLHRDELPPGCPFQPRCDFAEPSCAERHQVLERVAPGHEVACQRWRALGVAGRRRAGEASAGARGLAGSAAAGPGACDPGLWRARRLAVAVFRGQALRRGARI